MMHRPPHFPPMGQPNNHSHNPFDTSGQMNHQSPAIGGPGVSHGSQFHPAPSYSHSNSVSPGPHAQMPSPSTVPQHMGSGMSAGQSKRPYRQRRKDPSCDACRERKVKCDATETTSCNECKSRGVKCQFTKETNRRMSSIKQVQDLEKQLLAARRTIAELSEGRSVMEGSPAGNAENSHDVNPINVPEIGSGPQRRPRAPVIQDLTEVRSHLRNYGRGVFKPPPPYRQVGIQAEFPHPLPELPPNHIGERLLAQYYQTIHCVIPILHWPQFVQRYEDVKTHGDLSNVPPAWGSILFAVFACGLLYTVDPEIKRLYPDQGRNFIGYSRQLTDLFNDEFTIDHARAALLTSIFLTELNCKSAAWTWLGSTVRIAQDIGLHRESGPWSVVEGEMRRRVWWGIYVWDRLLSVELGRVLLIEDRDCDIELPCGLDDHFIYDTGVLMNQSATNANFLLTTIHVVRMISELLRSLQSPIISPQTLQTFDTHFTSCQNAFAPHCHIYHPQPLEPRYLSPICHLQNCRLVLHRHNLSTSCPLMVRVAAVSSCVDAAKDTAHLLSRVKQFKPTAAGYGWQNTVAEVATTMLCTHLWRCTLFLCFNANYDEALTCAEVSTAIGDVRDVNIACGRNLYGFLHMLAVKTARGIDIMQDEDMIALVSGDVQGSTESAWVWNGSETGTALNNSPPPNNPYTPGSSSSNGKESSTGGASETQTTLSSEEKREWGGWGHIQQIIKQLKKEKDEKDAVPRNHPPLSGNWDMSVGSSSSHSGSSRISIANII